MQKKQQKKVKRKKKHMTFGSNPSINKIPIKNNIYNTFIVSFNGYAVWFL